jgi:hypothetical protein
MVASQDSALNPLLPVRVARISWPGVSIVDRAQLAALMGDHSDATSAELRDLKLGPLPFAEEANGELPARAFALDRVPETGPALHSYFPKTT